MIVTEKDGQWTPEEIVVAGRRNCESLPHFDRGDDSEMNRMILSEMLKGEFEIRRQKMVQHVSGHAEPL